MPQQNIGFGFKPNKPLTNMDKLKIAKDAGRNFNVKIDPKKDITLDNYGRVQIKGLENTANNIVKGEKFRQSLSGYMANDPSNNIRTRYTTVTSPKPDLAKQPVVKIPAANIPPKITPVTKIIPPAPIPLPKPALNNQPAVNMSTMNVPPKGVLASPFASPTSPILSQETPTSPVQPNLIKPNLIQPVNIESKPTETNAAQVSNTETEPAETNQTSATNNQVAQGNQAKTPIDWQAGTSGLKAYNEFGAATVRGSTSATSTEGTAQVNRASDVERQDLTGEETLKMIMKDVDAGKIAQPHPPEDILGQGGNPSV